MNILFISPYLPSETSGHAGAQLIFRNIVSLAKNHQITLAAFIDSGEKKPEKVVTKSLKITSDICIYTNDNITVLKP